MKQEASFRRTTLLPSLALEKRMRDRAYLMELKDENLLFPYYAEAGLNGRLNYKVTDCHGGWDSPTSQLRGTFTGHWMSGAARVFAETGDKELNEKAAFIVSEIARCQQENGGQWCFGIPEKYLHALKRKQRFWVPQYVCHKCMMGLLDQYLFAGNTQALEILKKAADWFYDYTGAITREEMSDIMDFEETGGMMELWAELYAATGDAQHLELMHRYERPRLTDQLYAGKDVLTNMHANSTIPEIHGCARAYEVTGVEKYRVIVENFWKCAVIDRGSLATGGHNSGEVWIPADRQAERIGEVTQEHCTVYNMIRLADYLYRWTGEKQYADYIERNLYNGLFAQSFFVARSMDIVKEPLVPDYGMVAYYLPLGPGSQKKWSTKTDDLWCCQCTLVQANSRYREFIWYKNQDGINVAQYLPSETKQEINGVPVTLTQTNADVSGDCFEIRDEALSIAGRPDYQLHNFTVDAENPVKFTLRLRLPWWLQDKAVIWLNGERAAYEEKDGYAVLDREWSHDKLIVKLPKGLYCVSLSDEPDTVAFMDGPVLLAGLTDEERTLYGDKEHPETLLKPCDERKWNTWENGWRTVKQPVNIRFRPLYEIGREHYTVYFPMEKR